MQKARRRIGKDRDAPPRVLDLFAGGGAIPLEALRLGCDAYALDLANVTLLVEQEAEAVARDDTRVRSRIKVMVEERLAGHRSAIVWPAKSADVPDKEAQFLIAYLPIEFAALPVTERQQTARDLCENFGNRTREYRNGLALAVPSAVQIGILRRAVRYLLAVERVRSKSREHNLTDAQKSQLREREATEKAAAESALLKLYNEILLPGSAKGALSLDVVSMGGRPLQTTLDEKKRAQIHQRLLELLTTVQRKVFGTVAPGKIVDLFKLGAPESDSPGIQTDKVVAGFFSFLGFPRLHSEDVVRKAIARGAETGLFGYATGRPGLDDAGRFQIDRSRVAFERGIADDEIDMDSGFLIVPAALPEPPAATTSTTDGASAGEDITYPEPGGTARIREKPDTASEGKLSPEHTPGELTISFTASRDDLYAAWNAVANLADIAGRVSVNVRAASEDGLDKARIENGVLEPLRELGLLDDQQS